VTSQDWRIPAVQQRYWPHFPPFVKRLILESQHAHGNGHVIAVEEGGAPKGVIPELQQQQLQRSSGPVAAAAANGNGHHHHHHHHGANGH
jgi:hypothetical protein